MGTFSNLLINGMVFLFPFNNNNKNQSVRFFKDGPMKEIRAFLVCTLNIIRVPFYLKGTFETFSFFQFHLYPKKNLFVELEENMHGN